MIAFLVIFHLIKMDPTIYLYYQICLAAEEIYYVSSNDLLPPEMESFQSACPQPLPELLFG